MSQSEREKPVRRRDADDPYCGFESDRERRYALFAREFFSFAGKAVLVAALYFGAQGGLASENFARLLGMLARL